MERGILSDLRSHNPLLRPPSPARVRDSPSDSWPLWYSFQASQDVFLHHHHGLFDTARILYLFYRHFPFVAIFVFLFTL